MLICTCQPSAATRFDSGSIMSMVVAAIGRERRLLGRNVYNELFRQFR